MQELQPSGHDPADLARILAEAKAELAHSQHLQREASALLTRMAEQGKTADEHYQYVLAECQELGAAITDATRAIKDHEQARQALSAEAITGDFGDIARVVRPLGPPGPVGMVSEGEEVLNLQRFLGKAGFPVAESGRYDDLTGRAVQQLQKRLNLPVDGKVGAATRKAINDLVAHD